MDKKKIIGIVAGVIVIVAVIIGIGIYAVNKNNNNEKQTVKQYQYIDKDLENDEPESIVVKENTDDGYSELIPLKPVE